MTDSSSLPAVHGATAPCRSSPSEEFYYQEWLER